ncbi:FMN-dependent alpha-hydroxy acid dehydrogenase [Rhizorhabdus wittichii RW1]|uniref:FMN-dependent alpha-hydroxy acid dehydrogenase n=1 Tax=Rhizorhabdus wittichii (strain DSM 6014 / CCUG 31198 / JCM 15750 / NBRC 105917 / EY 4224 / RW1) TaxID=392499 RepID=A0A9J9HFA7_RHIWR|nr:FMN-dependent alpha-hydroxy acid dehydrogenase [Rhizorhabdus wittichii RW1]
MADVRHCVTIADLRAIARRRLPEFAFVPMETGSGDGSGPGRNVAAFDRFPLTARALVDVREVRQQVEIFGRPYASPFGLSAVGYANNLRPFADQMLAEAAMEAKLPFMLSGGSTAAIEEIARIAPGHVWQQLYSAKDPAITDRAIGRAADAGVEVLVHTVDSPVPPRNDWLARSGIALPAKVRWSAWPYVLWQAATHPRWSLGHLARGGLPRLESWTEYAPAGARAATIARLFQNQVPSVQTWDEVERIRRLWPGRLVIKGLVHAGDVRRARDCGADAVAVSNHGGNKLDVMPAAIDSLCALVGTGAPALPLFFDGGVRKGAHILIALALGARFAFAGRAPLYGVIAGGTAGALRAIDILKDEIGRTLALIGCPDAAGLDGGYLHCGAPTLPEEEKP